MKLPFKTIKDIPHIYEKTVILRSELNAPFFEGRILNEARLISSLPTIRTLLEKKARIIIISHTSNALKEENISLRHHFEWISSHLDASTFFIDSTDKASIKNILQEKKDVDIIFLENVRFFDGEMTNETNFSQFLASLGDVYVNDAFPVSHRNHASIVGIPTFLPSYAGLQFEREYKALTKIIHPERPFLFIVGGAKFETKLPLAEEFCNRADALCIGGALINPLLKEKGYVVGNSLLPDAPLSSIKTLIHSPSVYIPVDVLINTKGETLSCPSDSIPLDASIVDIGPKSISDLVEKINQSSSILWNGPLGNVERGFTKSTSLIAEAIKNSNAYSVVGGGDSIGYIGSFEGFDFVSTAGGAMVQFLLKGTLPGIEALVLSK